MTIYARPEAAASLRAWYPRFLALVDAPTASRTVPTRYGDTHVLVGGPPDAPPLVLYHGAMATSAHVLSEVKPLLERFRVYAVDIIGHSPMSADARPGVEAFGPWSTDVLDGLGLATTRLCAVSYGGFVGIRTVATNPTRIERLTLVVPGGLVGGSAWRGVTELAIPMAMYRWFPTPERLERFCRPQFTTLDDLWVPWLGAALLGFKIDFDVPPLATPEQLAAYAGPVQVFGASDDIHFPGAPLLERARVVFRNVVDAELLECKHSPPFEDGFRAWLSKRIGDFMEVSAG